MIPKYLILSGTVFNKMEFFITIEVGRMETFYQYPICKVVSLKFLKYLKIIHVTPLINERKSYNVSVLFLECHEKSWLENFNIFSLRK